MTAEQLARLDEYLRLLGGPVPHDWDGGPEGPAPDLYVSESESRHRQQAYDNWLERGSS